MVPDDVKPQVRCYREVRRSIGSYALSGHSTSPVFSSM
jgi:hypothetical protein